MSTVRVITQTARRIKRRSMELFVELSWALLLIATGYVFGALTAIIRGWKL